MYRFITELQEKNYFVRFSVDSDNRICSVFFCHEESIKETRVKPECVIIDATYKTNSSKLTFINIVGTCNASSVTAETRNHLQTFAIAGAWVSNELETSYKWALEQLKEAVWPSEEYGAPGVFITDNEKALRNAIDDVFPSSGHLLCAVHIMKNLKTHIGNEFTPHIPSYRAVLESTLYENFKKIAYCDSLDQMTAALDEMKKFLRTPGHCKKNGVKAIEYLDR
jgi:hypothetical protein